MSTGWLDLRSDTVTQPTEAMRRAMSLAEVGDDVFGEDPTVIRLEELAAEMTGQAAALFVPSGTMGNLIALITHTDRHMPEIIAEAHAHVVRHELGGYARLAHAALTTIDGRQGALDPQKLARLIHTDATIYHPQTALICVENTHNAAGGTIVPLENLRAVTAIAQQHKVACHLDGARLFNAAAALQTSARAVAAGFDSVMFCLSKGLSAPVGSMLAGSAAFIARARATRKMLGGGMRQAGILAAAGIIALREMTGRIGEDHETARRIALGLAEINGISLDLATVQSNMIRFSIAGTHVTDEGFIDRLRTAGVLAFPVGDRMIRFVTHRHIGLHQVETIVRAVAGAV